MPARGSGHIRTGKRAQGASVTGFELYLKANARAFDNYLATFFGDGTHPDMARYLYNPLSVFSDNSGKRHRPLICLLACEAVGGDPKVAWPAAAAIEHFHTAALIHDDIEDSSLTRRDQPCMHITEGIGLAINAGDLALSLVCGTVVHDPGLDDTTKIRVLAELVDMTSRTIEGQALDIGWARDGRFDVTVDDYLTMANHKTAYYSGGVPLAVGAIIGGGSTAQVETLRAFGMAAGLAFQIQDDVLNLVGTKESTKKDFRSDVAEGKRTLIAIHALQNSPSRDRLLEILSARTTDPALLGEAVRIMDDAGSIEFARTYACDLIVGAKAGLIDSVPKSRARDLLGSMADYFVKRSS
jgi:geranylgeranyl diphosphate synthase, type I